MAKRVISAVLTLKDKDFSSGVKKASNNTNDLERKVKQTGNKITSFGKSAMTSFNNIAQSAVGLIGAFAGFAGITDIATDIVETESAFDRLSAKTGLAGKDLEGLQGIANEVFTAGFGENITEVADQVATLRGMFGDLSNNEMQELALGANTISDLWGTGVDEVGRAIKTLTTNFEGLSNTDAMDLVTTAFQRTGDYAGDLLDTFSEYSGYFADMGLGAQEFTNMLIKGSEAGAFNLDKVGDAVKEFGIRAIDGSKTTLEGFEAIGLNADDMASKIAQGGDTAQQAFMATVAGLANIEDEVARNQAGVSLFGTQWEDLRGDVVLAMSDGTNALGEFEGATKQAEETMHKGFGARMTSMWRELKVGISDAFKDSGGSELLDTLATKTEALVPIFTGLVTKAVEGATWIKDNWSRITPVLSAFAPLLGGITAGLVAFKVATIAVTAAQTAWKAVTTGVQIATALLNGTLAISPLGWVAIAIGAVVAIGIVLWKNWDTIREKAIQLWTVIKEKFAGIKDSISTAIQPIIEWFGSLKDKWDAFKDAISNFKLPGWVSKITDMMGGGAVGKIKDWVQGSFAVGTNNVPSDMVAEIHKGEMIIPARQSERLRQQGVTIDNIDKLATNQSVTSMPVATSTNNSRSVVIENLVVQAKGVTAMEVVSELVPELKLALGNM